MSASPGEEVLYTKPISRVINQHGCVCCPILAAEYELGTETLSQDDNFIYYRAVADDSLFAEAVAKPWCCSCCVPPLVYEVGSLQQVIVIDRTSIESVMSLTQKRQEQVLCCGSTCKRGCCDCRLMIPKTTKDPDEKKTTQLEVKLNTNNLEKHVFPVPTRMVVQVIDNLLNNEAAAPKQMKMSRGGGKIRLSRNMKSSSSRGSNESRKPRSAGSSHKSNIGMVVDVDTSVDEQGDTFRSVSEGETCEMDGDYVIYQEEEYVDGFVDDNNQGDEDDDGSIDI